MFTRCRNVFSSETNIIAAGLELLIFNSSSTSPARKPFSLTPTMKLLSIAILCFAFISAAHGRGPRSYGQPSHRVHGVLDGVNKHHMWGWSCQDYEARSLYVHVYLDNRFFKSVKANRHSESAVGRACKTTFNRYRFQIIFTPHELRVHAGKKVDVYGIAVVGNMNGRLHNSGRFRIPGRPSPSPRPNFNPCSDGYCGY